MNRKIYSKPVPATAQNRARERAQVVELEARLLAMGALGKRIRDDAMAALNAARRKGNLALTWLSCLRSAFGSHGRREIELDGRINTRARELADENVRKGRHENWESCKRRARLDLTKS